MTWRYWQPYRMFHQACIETNDIDPVYPVLRKLCETNNLNADERVVAVFLHVAYYQMGSALTALDQFLVGRRIARLPTDLPCGTERRGHRVPARLADHLAAVETWLGQHPAERIWSLIEGYALGDFDRLVGNLRTITQNGRWASYKTAEMLWKVCDFPIEAGRLEISGSSGPAAGLQLLAPDQRPTEELAHLLMLDLEAESGWPAAAEQVETTLCDFHSLVHGRYYVGHDIDQMAAQLFKVPENPLVREAFGARAAVLPYNYLGEYQDDPWFGPDRQRCLEFRHSGRVVLR